MKHGLPIEIDWAYMGSIFATLGDEEQSLFFKAMVKEMGTWETSFQRDSQMAAIAQQLSNDEKEALGNLTYVDEKESYTVSPI